MIPTPVQEHRRTGGRCMDPGQLRARPRAGRLTTPADPQSPPGRRQVRQIRLQSGDVGANAVASRVASFPLDLRQKPSRLFRQVPDLNLRASRDASGGASMPKRRPMPLRLLPPSRRLSRSLSSVPPPHLRSACRRPTAHARARRIFLPMRRLIWAQTIAACLLPYRRGPVSSGSSMLFRGSFAWAKG